MDAKQLIEAMRKTASPKPIPVNIPGWGELFVKPQTVEEVDLTAEEKQDEGGKKRRLARGAARVICDQNGERVFDPENPEHLALLAAQPWSMLQKVIAKMNGDDEDATGNVQRGAS